MSVQEAYREFRDGNFRVNRRYQRKLVWTLAEKQKLVDSILEGYGCLAKLTGDFYGRRAHRKPRA